MSWKRIKTFLIILFLLINLYLVLSDSGNLFGSKTSTRIDEKSITQTVDILADNYNIKLDKSIFPTSIDNLNNIDVTNYIYSEEITNSDYNISVSGAKFSSVIETDTYSYNETNAKKEFVALLSSLGIKEGTYKLYFYKTDAGLACYAQGYIDKYPLFNSSISALFGSRRIAFGGQWYLSNAENIELTNDTIQMCAPSSVLIDAAERATTTETPSNSFEKISYGYFASYYDEYQLSKTASAIPCYVIETDIGSKYYYDALNGNFLKQED